MAAVKLLFIISLLAILAFENVELSNHKLRASDGSAETKSVDQLKVILQLLKNTGHKTMEFLKSVIHHFRPDLISMEPRKKTSGFEPQTSSEMENYKKGVAKGLVMYMFRGEGGTSVISYNKKEVLVSNGRVTVCSGSLKIFKRQVMCIGREKSAPASDLCRPGKIMKKNKNGYCLIDDDLVDPDFDPSGRGYKCPGNNIFSTEELEEQCGSKVLSDKYATVTYFPDPTQPNHIPIPNPNPYIGCKNPDAKICKFKVGLSGPK